MTLGSLRRAAAGELSEFLQESGERFAAMAWVQHALRARGKVLAAEDGFAWGLLPLLVCDAAGGDADRALPLGSAVECFIAALDTIDDIQDGDAPDALWRACGLPTALNVATFLIFLSQLAIGRLQIGGADDRTIAAILQTFARLGSRACGGQQRDLDLVRGQVLTEDQYLEMIAQKSAALVECACRAGALMSPAAPETIESFAQFGFHLGVAMQIGNDINGASTERFARRDLQAGSCTLPLIFAFECSPLPVREELAAIYDPERRDDLTRAEVDRVAELLLNGGALEYATVIADVFWERALSCLAHAGCQTGSPLFDLVTQLRRD